MAVHLSTLAVGPLSTNSFPVRYGVYGVSVFECLKGLPASIKTSHRPPHEKISPNKKLTSYPIFYNFTGLWSNKL
jgi:hypothetical protein